MTPVSPVERRRVEPAEPGGTVITDLVTAQVDGRAAYDTDGTRPEAVSGWNADIEVGGTTIAAGDLVVLDLRDANQNAERFPVPADFDVRRTDNPHVTFGHGPRLRRRLGGAPGSAR